MLQLIAGLILLIELPVWALMIFRPKQELTRQIVSGYLIFVPLGLLFIFLGIGLIAVESGLLATVSSAIDAGDAASAAGALKGVQTGLDALAIGVLAALTVMDLAGGHIIYTDLHKRGVSDLTAGLLLALTYLTGPIGMFVFAAWRYLTTVQQQIQANVPAPSIIQPGA